MKITTLVLCLVSSVVACVALGCSGGSDEGSSSGSTNGNGSGNGGGSGSTSGKFTCDSTSKCPAERAATDTEKANCRTILAGNCGTVYQAFGDCSLANESCKSDGTADDDVIGTKCKTEQDALSKCLLGAGAADGGV